MLRVIGLWFSQAVASRDVQALFNKFNVSLAIIYCLLTTQYCWFLEKESKISNFLDVNVSRLHLFQSVYYILTPTIIEIKSVVVDENRKISENLNEQMFNNSFSYLELSLAEKINKFRTLFDCKVFTCRPRKLQLTTRATLRTVLAISLNPLAQLVIRKQ